jgi:hypothetical protein
MEGGELVCISACMYAIRLVCMQGWEEATNEVQVLRNALAVTRFVLGDTVPYLSLSVYVF